MVEPGYPAPGRTAASEGGYGPSDALRQIRVASLALVTIALIGTAGYMLLLGWPFLDALYMTVISMTTVGYKEVHDLSNEPVGQLWTMLILLTGVGTLFYAVVSFVELVVEGTVRGYFVRRRVKAEIDKLNDHYVLCGYGRVGRQVAREFAADGTRFVVVDQQEASVEECLQKGYLALLGDAAIEEAGIRRAQGLVAAVDSDADNVFVVLSARQLNPGLHIVARASSDESAAKLEIAGADRTLSPYAVGGRRLASLATQPLIVDFLDIVTRGEKGLEFRLEEFGVPKESPLANHTIGKLKIGAKTGAMVLAIRTPEGRFDTTPSAQDEIHPGDTLIVLGTREQVGRLEALMRDEELTDEDPRNPT